MDAQCNNVVGTSERKLMAIQSSNNIDPCLMTST